LVHHAERSGQIGVILAAGPNAVREAARLGAHRHAAEVLRVVLEHRALLGPHDVADLFTRRAYSLYLVNQFEAALRCAESGVMTAEEAGDTILLADALLVLARVVMFARGPLRARQAAERAVDILEPVGMTLGWRPRSRSWRARLDEAERYVAAGLPVAADVEFVAGQHRLRLTSAAVPEFGGLGPSHCRPACSVEQPGRWGPPQLGCPRRAIRAGRGVGDSR
jgi:hypothetical protein